MPDVTGATAAVAPSGQLLGLLVVILAGLALGALAVARKLAFYRNFGFGGSSTPPKTNCSACGARVPADQDRCAYCDEPLEAGDHERRS